MWESTKPLALAYVRVSTTAQAEEGASLDAQRSALEAEAGRRGWDLEVVTESQSAKNLNRPALQAALKRLDRGDAQFLMALRLDRLSRSVVDFGTLLDRSQRKGWGLVLLSPNVDTSDPSGRFSNNVLAAAAQYERELISQRTREGMAQRKAEGVVFGRVVDDSMLPTYRRINSMRNEGLSMRAIAQHLNDEAVPAAKGGQWHASTVRAVLTSQTMTRLVDAI
jgi:DNA invertase Pin-like site-specific DNA recombinase